MAAIPAIASDAVRGLRACGFGSGSASAFSMKWAALHDVAAAVARIGGLEDGPLPSRVRNFPVMMRKATAFQRELAEQGLEDLAAVMTPGLAALLATLARGADPRPAAAALWREFAKGRDRLLDLA